MTIVATKGNVITQIKKTDKESYDSIQLGFGIKKRTTKSLVGHIKKAGVKNIPRFFREVRIKDVGAMSDLSLGEEIKVSSVLKPGDIIQVTGISKGKGFAGGVKRHHFKGGPRTHGQSDRERAPGSIGQTTTPGRVYRGKRMAGRMGHERVTIKNLEVIDVLDDLLLIKGLLPGGVNSLVMIRKIADGRKFIPLYKDEEEQPVGAVAEKSSETQEGVKAPKESSKVEEAVKEGEENASEKVAS